MFSEESISYQIWDIKYRYKAPDGTPIDKTFDDTWRRVAKALASQEKDPIKFEAEFYDCIKDWKFIPGGRILSNAGTERAKTTMFNCFVIGIQDSMSSIFDSIKSASIIQKYGGGFGINISALRPSGAYVAGADANSSGPISFLKVFSAANDTVMSAGQRRSAAIALMACDHPDIEAFVDAKRDGKSLQNFNLSVAITDKFVEAVQKNTNWDLQFGGKIYRTVKAKELWEKIIKSTYDYAEPGVFFIDKVNKMNNLHYCENIEAVNPCGEAPLPEHGSCLLGSVNLSRFVKNEFTENAEVDYDGIRAVTSVAVRMLDNVIDMSKYPSDEIEKEAKSKRRMGMGITGLADMFAMLRVKYGSAESVELADKVMKAITEAAYESSMILGKEKGSFPMFDKEKYLEGEFIKKLPKPIRTCIEDNGTMRNSHLTSIAPTGTISLVSGNVSSGLEPIFALTYTRKYKIDGIEKEQVVQDYAVSRYMEKNKTDKMPAYFVTMPDIKIAHHIEVQAALQRWVDSSISKTINCPEDIPFDEFQDVYMQAYKSGLKGCTTFRPNKNIRGILTTESKDATGTIKRPETLAVDIHHFNCAKEKWVAFVGKHNNAPFEIFAGLSNEVSVPTKYDTAHITKRTTKTAGKYDLHINKDTDSEIIVKNITGQFKNELYGSITRLVSLSLRHGANVVEVCDQMERSMPPEIDSFYRSIMRILKRYIPDMAQARGLCPECGSSQMVYSDGCKKCQDCQWTACS